MKVLIDIWVDGYTDPEEYKKACIQALTEGASDIAHASTKILWVDDKSDL